jgi:hypothetical protein
MAKVCFDPGFMGEQAQADMAAKARKIGQSYSNTSASHYTAWMRLADALEGKGEPVRRRKKKRAKKKAAKKRKVKGSQKVNQLVRDQFRDIYGS